jgi:hypothetical protein
MRRCRSSCCTGTGSPHPGRCCRCSRARPSCRKAGRSPYCWYRWSSCRPDRSWSIRCWSGRCCLGNRARLGFRTCSVRTCRFRTRSSTRFGCRWSHRPGSSRQSSSHWCKRCPCSKARPGFRRLHRGRSSWRRWRCRPNRPRSGRSRWRPSSMPRPDRHKASRCRCDRRGRLGNCSRSRPGQTRRNPSISRRRKPLGWFRHFPRSRRFRSRYRRFGFRRRRLRCSSRHCPSTCFPGSTGSPAGRSWRISTWTTCHRTRGRCPDRPSWWTSCWKKASCSSRHHPDCFRRWRKRRTSTWYRTPCTGFPSRCWSTCWCRSGNMACQARRRPPTCNFRCCTCRRWESNCYHRQHTGSKHSSHC